VVVSSEPTTLRSLQFFLRISHHTIFFLYFFLSFGLVHFTFTYIFTQARRVQFKLMPWRKPNGRKFGSRDLIFQKRFRTIRFLFAESIFNLSSYKIPKLTQHKLIPSLFKKTKNKFIQLYYFQVVHIFILPYIYNVL